MRQIAQDEAVKLVNEFRNQYNNDVLKAVICESTSFGWILSFSTIIKPGGVDDMMLGFPPYVLTREGRVYSSPIHTNIELEFRMKVLKIASWWERFRYGLPGAGDNQTFTLLSARDVLKNLEPDSWGHGFYSMLIRENNLDGHGDF